MGRGRRLRSVLLTGTILVLPVARGFASSSHSAVSAHPRYAFFTADDCTNHVSEQRLQAEDRVLLLVNQQRQKQGIAPLTTSDALRVAAREHSCRMAALNYFDHVDPDLGNPVQRLQATGFPVKRVGENIAEELVAHDPVGHAVESWMSDPAHRQDILDPGFGCTGVGVAIKQNGTYLITEMFTPAPCPTAPEGYRAGQSEAANQPPTESVGREPKLAGTQGGELMAKAPAGNQVNAPPPPCKLIAEPAQIEKAGMDVKLTWEYPPGSKGVVLTEGSLKEIQNLNNPSGSATVKPSGTTMSLKASSAVIYHVKGTAPDGKKFDCEVKVQIGPLPPTCTIKASSKDKPGGPIILEWESVNAEQAKLRITEVLEGGKLGRPTGKQPEDVPVKGKKEVPSPGQRTTYTLQVTNKGVSGECSIDVAKPTCTFAVRHSKDDEYRFAWNTTFADKVEISPQPGGVELKSAANGQSVKVNKSGRYTLTATGLAGVAECHANLCRPNEKEEKKLAVKQVYQTNFMWCWITCGQMIFDYYDIPSIAEAYIKHIKTNEKVENWGFQCVIIAVAMPICGYGCQNCKNTGGFKDDVIRMLDEYPKKVNDFIDKGWIQHAKVRPIGAAYVPKALTQAEIKEEIDARPKGRPIIAGIKPGWAAELIKRLGKGQGASHVVLITGYEQVAGGRMCIRINDPWPHDPGSDPYLKLGGTKNPDGSYSIDYETFTSKEGMHWVESFKGIAPK